MNTTIKKQYMKRMIMAMAIALGFFMANAQQPAPKSISKGKSAPHQVVGTKKPEVKPMPTHLVEIETDYGKMVLKLYNETPLHRDNFIKLVTNGFYDSLLFHRIIPQFMIQGGDPLSKHAMDGLVLGSGD